MLSCPNCGRDLNEEPGKILDETHVESGCVLAGLLGVVEDRGEPIDKEKFAAIDPNYFWDMVGPIADWLQEEVKP